MARAGFVEVEGTHQPAPAPKFSRTPGEVSAPASLAGEHSREILMESGFSQQDVDALEQLGVIRCLEAQQDA